LQTDLPKDAKPLTFCIYADKTKLSSFGTQKGYPVIARCTNLPVNLRNGTGPGGGRVVGWLPIVGSLIFFTIDILITNKKGCRGCGRIWEEEICELQTSCLA